MTTASGDRRLSLLAVLAVIAGTHLALWPRLASLDAFYHIGHAAHFVEAGPFDVAFPWATQSVIGAVGADLWWGFHVVLMPFAALLDPAMAVRAAAVACTAVLAGAVAWALRRFSVAGAGWWTALFLLAVPNVLYRYAMVRPHVLSLAAALLLTTFLVRGRAWQVALAAAAITWLHLSLFWMAPGILCAWLLARRLTGAGAGDRAAEGTSAAGGGPDAPLRSGPGAVEAVAAVVVGSLAGWLLRPNAVGAASLAWIQIVELFAEKGTEQPIPFATELQPLPVLELVRTSWMFLAAWAAAVGGAVALRRGLPQRMGPDRWLLTVTALLCSGAFVVLAVGSARRAQVEWVAFGFLALPLMWTATREWLPRAVPPVLAAALAVHLVWGGYRHTLNARLVAYPPDLLRGAATWLAANAEPGQVVFHAKWDNFGPLFARNRQNLYLSGMDPIFFYRHDPARYWEFFFLSADATTEYTCDAFPCADGTATGTHEAIRDHFGARWVVVEPQRNPRLTEWLRTAPGFALAVNTGRELVFEVLP